jgi:hypothetical protein
VERRVNALDFATPTSAKTAQMWGTIKSDSRSELLRGHGVSKEATPSIGDAGAVVLYRDQLLIAKEVDPVRESHS